MRLHISLKVQYLHLSSSSVCLNGIDVSKIFLINVIRCFSNSSRAFGSIFFVPGGIMKLGPLPGDLREIIPALSPSFVPFDLEYSQEYIISWNACL